MLVKCLASIKTFVAPLTACARLLVAQHSRTERPGLGRRRLDERANSCPSGSDGLDLLHHGRPGLLEDPIATYALDFREFGELLLGRPGAAPNALVHCPCENLRLLFLWSLLAQFTARPRFPVFLSCPGAPGFDKPSLRTTVVQEVRPQVPMNLIFSTPTKNRKISPIPILDFPAFRVWNVNGISIILIPLLFR